MRILMITAAYSPDSGGVATHVINLASGLVRHWHDVFVDVLTLRKPGSGYKKDVKGNLIEWKLERKTVPEFSGRRVVLERLTQFAMDHWHELHPDIVHAHDYDSLLIGLMLRTAFSTPLVLTVHRAPTDWLSARYQQSPKDSLVEAVRRHKFVDSIVVPSKSSRNVLREQGFRKIEVIPHAIHKHLLSFESDVSVLRQLNIPDDALLIFCPVRADEHKDPHIFIRGAARLRDMLPNRHIVFLVTSEPEEATEQTAIAMELREIARVHNLTEGEDIIFEKPFQYGVPLATIYRRLNAVVVPSLHESFGQNVLDAFMFRKPVVARSSKALKEIVKDRVNGLLFNTSDELARQLHRLLVDALLSAGIVQAAENSLVKYYNVPKMVARYRALYKRVLQQKRKRG